ncbi:hypothetical protein DM02DRAFT_118064 [Periconia macrospinosa]|uniref:Uncharacterized protein n=1 Tax=Periconia macrospinosa TaxID=97972 RepID=A0A2V1DEF4_9PLEO|nr:hypothetical protein DM02DRAFT_118064 [Periconia macrospinosa]
MRLTVSALGPGGKSMGRHVARDPGRSPIRGCAGDQWTRWERHFVILERRGNASQHPIAINTRPDGRCGAVIPSSKPQHHSNPPFPFLFLFFWLLTSIVLRLLHAGQQGRNVHYRQTHKQTNK